MAGELKMPNPVPDFEDLCKQVVCDYFNDNVDVTDGVKITADQVYVVWKVKVLEHRKALVSTTIPDGMYYEITYDGKKNQVYLDAYKKWANRVITI